MTKTEPAQLLNSQKHSIILGMGNRWKFLQLANVRNSLKKQSTAQMMNMITPISWPTSIARNNSHLKFEK
jgi:hypothetical protein